MNYLITGVHNLVKIYTSGNSHKSKNSYIELYSWELKLQRWLSRITEIHCFFQCQLTFKRVSYANLFIQENILYNKTQLWIYYCHKIKIMIIWKQKNLKKVGWDDVNWIHHIHDKTQYLVLGNLVMNISVGNFLTCLVTINFSSTMGYRVGHIRTYSCRILIN
jgi:hypothetical protein